MFGAWRRFQTERNYLLQFLVNKKQQINDDEKQTISIITSTILHWLGQIMTKIKYPQMQYNAG